jgi:predicted transcriptional regulator
MRKAIGLTQQDLAARLVTGQGSVSKLEHAADMYLSTLRKYVEALGGELHLVASFPEGRKVEIGCLADE